MANSVCPGCGHPVPPDTVWVYQQSFFCNQECVEAYRGNRT